MDSYDPVEKVLSTNQFIPVLELILEYAASEEEWQWSRNLRLVSKLWRSLSFKGLCRSTQLPKLKLGLWNWNNLAFAHTLNNVVTVDFETVFKKFPQKSSLKTTLSQPMLPIDLIINRYPKPAEVSFILKISSHIASVEVSKQTFGPKPFGVKNAHLDSRLQLPNLRRFCVCWQNAMHDPLFTEIVEQIGRSFKRLYDVQYHYHSILHTANWPRPPSNLTHLSHDGCVDQLKTLTNGLVKTVTGLAFKLNQRHIGDNELTFDCSALTGILQPQCETLNNLKISSWHEIPLSGVVELINPRFLKRLSSAVPVHFKQDENIPAKMPKLRHLSYTIGYHPGNVSAALETMKIFSSTLEFLEFKWLKFRSFSRTNSDFIVESRECEEKFLWELDQGIPFCPELSQLKILKFPFRVGISLMPKVYEFMMNITKMSLHFQRSNGQGRPTQYDDRNFFKILTGCDLEDVPTDELMWPKFFVRKKRHSITKLKSLKHFEVGASEGLKCILGRFIFRAGFMQMKTLRRIDVQGGIWVHPDMIKEWNECGGVITLDDYSQHLSKSHQPA